MTPTALRAWEKRFGLFSPTRTAAGYRLYSPEDIEVLRGAAALVAAGHSIGEVATRPRDELRRAANLREETRSPAALSTAEGGPVFEPAIERAVGAARALHREEFEAALLPVLGLGALSPADACEHLLLPLLRRIGAEWAAGRLSVAAEHFASSVVRAKLLHYLDYLPRPVDGPLVVCACPGEERHELGLLAFAVHASSTGWRAVVLGAATPFAEAVDAAVRLDAELLALGLIMDLDPGDREQLAACLARARGTCPLRVVAGGPGAERSADFLASIGGELSRTFRAPLPAQAGQTRR